MSSHLGQFGVKGIQSERHWPAITLQEAQTVLSHFASVTTSPDHILWHGQRPFSATALLKTTDQSTFFIKRHSNHLRNQNALSSEHHFMHHLAGHHLPINLPLLTRDHTRTVSSDHSTYEIFRPIAGLDLYRNVQSWEPYLNVEHAFTAGKELAKLHLASETYHAPKRTGQLLLSCFDVITQPDLLTGLQQWIPTQPGLSDTLKRYPWRKDIALFFPFHHQLKPYLSSIQSCWGHGDWHPSNLFWQNNQPSSSISGIFDFGMSNQTCTVYDLAVALERTMISWLSSTYTITWDRLQSFLKGYQSKRSLSPAECHLLIHFLPLVHLEFALSEVSYYDQLVLDSLSADSAYYDYLLGHGEWFSSSTGQAFLEELKNILITGSQHVLD
ncbi:phosphotransferase enzyme family protein [Swingsia samuiensis]|uniref:Aminoglycoside phosphotransferase domain-containing protein n=1 Tax=Swingsia samuiensis TaxID=1293412 RepID=A0A4Y6UL74_9PROT|nr:phosphotransferase [Swingsia samuiensis]QDH17141.1 hypothetical protein E3D00_05855 [Swingsia samuiensis]